MTPHKQLHRHDPAAGVYGDCCRTVYACLLDKHPSEVPHFAERHWNDLEAGQRAEDEYLESQGLRLIRIVYPGDESTLSRVHAWAKYWMPGMYYVLSGTSRNGTDHVVICCDGEIIHDPAQDDSGVVGPCSDGNYWVYLFASSRFARSAPKEVAHA